MKILGVVLLMAVATTWPVASAYADTSDQPASVPTGAHAPIQNGQKVAKQNLGNKSQSNTPDHKVSLPGTTKPGPQQVADGKKSPAKKQDASNQANSTSAKPIGNGSLLPQPKANQSVHPANSGAMVNKPNINHGLPIHPPGLLPSAGPSLSDVRHRGPNPPLIGGAAKSKNDTATINGTGMDHKR